MVGLVADPLLGAFHRVASQLPALAAALLLLLVGMFAARALRTLAERVLDRARLDEYTAKVGINEVLARLGLGKSPAFALAFLIYWFVLFAFIVSAANAVSMTVVSELLERFALFLPSLIASLLILFGGLLFARFLSEIVENAAAANGVRGGSFLARACSGIVILFAGMTALEQLGLRLSLITAALQIVLASAGLAAAIAFGLGGKDAAAELLRDVLKKKS